MATRAAFFFLDTGARPEMAASRNLDVSLLTGSKLNLIERVITDTAKRGKGMALTSTDKKSDFAKPLQEAGIRSLVCLPASLDERAYGYLYLDNPAYGTFAEEEDSPFLRMLCSQIAIALSGIYTYEEMRELKNRFEEEAIFYKREMGVAGRMEIIIGQSEAMEHVLDLVRQVSATDSTVLILGETGVGKELVAKSIHGLSPRKNGPFIPVNLAALPQELVASELFGHEKGSFTGANERQKGRFELADGGTIFLDEIGDLPLSVQAKLLRVLQEGTFERLGSSQPIKPDFRVVAATNKDLAAEVEKGAFRQDLFYRLNVFPIHVPALRDRKEDIPLLVNFFVSKFSKKIGKMVRTIPPEEMRKLLRYDWPGNVRELKHITERSIILLHGDRIRFDIGRMQEPKTTSSREPHDELPGAAETYSPDMDGAKTSLADMERKHIMGVLERTHWRVSGPFGAAGILGLKPTTLFFRMSKLGISKPK
jgi:transcriptional regulator with GAF, ATPase, and Fis domain